MAQVTTWAESGTPSVQHYQKLEDALKAVLTSQDGVRFEVKLEDDIYDEKWELARPMEASGKEITIDLNGKHCQINDQSEEFNQVNGDLFQLERGTLVVGGNVTAIGGYVELQKKIPNR